MCIALFSPAVPRGIFPPIPLKSCPQGEGTSILKSQAGGLWGSEGLMIRYRWSQQWTEGNNSCHPGVFYHLQVISPENCKLLEVVGCQASHSESF